MDILALFLVGIAPFLVGLMCLLWGLRRLHHHQAMGAEIGRDYVSYCFIVSGCILVAIFFPVTLLAASVPSIVATGIVVALGFLLIALGEWYIRSAAVTLRGVPPGAPWIAFLGVLMLISQVEIHIMNLPRLLGGFLFLAVFVLLRWGQALLNKALETHRGTTRGPLRAYSLCRR